MLIDFGMKNVIHRCVGVIVITAIFHPKSLSALATAGNALMVELSGVLVK